MGSDASQLRLYGERLREKEKYLQALQVLDKSILACQREKNYRVMVDALKDRCLTWKHLFLLTKDSAFFVLVKKDAEAMLALCEGKNLVDKFATAYFRLGEVAMLVEDFGEAIAHFTKALSVFTGPAAERGDYRYHLGEVLYRSGKRSEGKRAMLKGLTEIRQGSDKVNPFYIRVWETGCLLRLAGLLKNDAPAEAEKYLAEAKTIVDSDRRLVIRRRQVEELAKTLRSRLAS